MFNYWVCGNTKFWVWIGFFVFAKDEELMTGRKDGKIDGPKLFLRL